MRKLLTIAMLAAVSTPMLAAFGCAESGNKPYSLTGEQNLTVDQQRWVNQQSIDSKGHFNPVLHQRALDQVSSAARGAH